MELARLQALLYRLIIAPGGVDDGIAAEASFDADRLEAIICSDEVLSARERVGIYADAYFYRLLEVLKEDFPAVLAVLGETGFHNLITGYLIAYPPAAPSIFYAGAHLADYLRGSSECERWPFLPDLATLERTLLEVFHAVDAVPLDAAAMNLIAPAEWPTIGLRIHPAARLLALDWQVAATLRAVERQQSWAAPQAGPSPLLVWRRDGQAFYRALETGERTALMIARKGATFAVICEAIANEAGGLEPAALISRLLGRWLNEGVLLRDPA